MALVRIWIDIEHELRTHMAVRGWLQYVSRNEASQYLSVLVKQKTISQETAESIVAFYTLRNRIIHGKLQKAFSERELVALIDTGLRLVEILRSIPRATYTVRALVPFFSYAAAREQVEGARAVVLEVTTGDGKRRYGAYPTTKDYEPGQSLSWEWNLGKVWGRSWFRDIESGEIKKAWDSAAEFAGRPLESVA